MQNENLGEMNQESCGRPRAKRADPYTVILIFIALFAILYLLYSLLRSAGGFDFTTVKVFNTVFISILMQAFPFMLIGVLVSSALHVFVPDAFIVRIFPAKYGLGFLTALFAGIFFPVCECAIVPVMTRLVKKGVPLPVALTFMLSAPIINPIVIIATLYAFPGQPEIALMRVCFGLSIALVTGLILFRLMPKGRPLPLKEKDHSHCLCGHEDGGSDHECACCAHTGSVTKEPLPAKLREMFLHSGEEFFSVGKYLIIGAFIAGLIQTFVPKSAFLGLASQNGLSLLLMMAMAFLFSACSTSDAFIARSFMNQLSLGAIMGFMVFGPMMDIKNLLMLFDGFRKRFVVKLALLIFVLNFIILYFLAFLFL